MNNQNKKYKNSQTQTTKSGRGGEKVNGVQYMVRKDSYT